MKFIPKLNISAYAPRGLFTRSLLIIVIPVVTLLMLVTYVFFDRHWEAVTRRLAESVAAEVSLVAQIIQKHPEMDEKQLLALARQSTNLRMVFERGKTKTVTWRQRNILTRLVGSTAKSGIPYPSLVHLARNGKDIEMVVKLPDGVLTVIVPKRRVFTATTYIVIWWLFGSALVMVTVAVLFMRGQVRPIKRLAAAAESFGKGIDLPSFKPEGAREIRRAAQAFLNMKERIQRQLTQRTEMLAGVSHDLRTPLTRMKLQLAMMKEQEGLSELQTDITEMEQMINAYLDFVRGEGGEENSNFDLIALLHDSAEQARRLTPGISCNVKTDNEVLFFTGRRMALQRCINNLVGNAQRYANIIEITILQMDDKLIIQIDDNGPGIPPEKHEDVFRAFYRLDASRNLATGGVGLGLTIARDIIRSHGGDILLETSSLGGLRANVVLPV